MVPERKHVHTSTLKAESLFNGNIKNLDLEKNQKANLIHFSQKPRYIPMLELLSAIKPTRHLIFPHI